MFLLYKVLALVPLIIASTAMPVAERFSTRATFDLKFAAIAYATAYLPSNNGVGVMFRSSDITPAVQTAFLSQTQNGVPLVDADATVSFDDDNQVVGFDSSFVTLSYVSANVPSVTLASVTSIAAAQLKGTYVSAPVDLEYFVQPGNKATLVYVFQIQTSTTTYTVYADAKTRAFLSIVDNSTKQS